MTIGLVGCILGGMANDSISHKLNHRQEAFCRGVLAGLSQAEAYRRAGYSPTRAESRAAELVRTPAVSGFLAAERARSRKMAVFTRQAALRVLQEVAESGDTSAARVGAVATAARMEGWNEPDKLEHGVTDKLAVMLSKVRGRA